MRRVLPSRPLSGPLSARIALNTYPAASGEMSTGRKKTERKKPLIAGGPLQGQGERQPRHVLGQHHHQRVLHRHAQVVGERALLQQVAEVGQAGELDDAAVGRPVGEGQGEIEQVGYDVEDCDDGQGGQQEAAGAQPMLPCARPRAAARRAAARPRPASKPWVRTWMSSLRAAMGHGPGDGGCRGARAAPAPVPVRTRAGRSPARSSSTAAAGRSRPAPAWRSRRSSHSCRW